MPDAAKIIKDWCASCGMPEPSDGECHALAVAISAAAPVVLPEQDAVLLNQGVELLHALSNDERNRGNCSSAEGATASAYAVQRLAAMLATGGQAHAVEQEPFGYFKAEPFGWTDCGPDDEGAVALYERPQAKADAPAPADPSETIKSLPRYTVGRSALDGSMHTFKTEDGPFLRVNEVLEAFAAAKEQGQ